MRTLLHQLTRWLFPKAMPGAYARGPWTTLSGPGLRSCQPSPAELTAGLKGTAWTCATINASVCASHPPRLYVVSQAGQSAPKCLTRALEPAADRRLRALPRLPPAVAKAAQIAEVVDHPLLTLLQQVNPVMNAFDLWELTTLYQEVHGSAFWLLTLNSLGVPEEIWVLPSQHVTPYREPGSTRIVDYYLYRSGGQEQRFTPRQVIHFRYPDPRDPYTSGLSPLRACWEQVALLSDYAAMKKSVYDNNAVPAAVVCPDEIMGKDERDRLEAQWNQKFRKDGAGRVLVAESGMKIQVLSHSMGDLAALADMRATKEDICNAFHVPLAFLTAETNLANLQAAEHQHLSQAIAPRVRRRDEKLNEQLVPLFDPSGRLFVATDDPVPASRELRLRQQEVDLKFGVVTVNEVRQERGLPPVPWGDTPFVPPFPSITVPPS